MISYKGVTYRLAKYVNDGSSVCGLCKHPLIATKLEINPKHVYDIGMLYTCKCKKSKLWTNSVRNETKLLAYFDAVRKWQDDPKRSLSTAPEKYYAGFCNDKFCGACLSYIYVLKNGVEVPGHSDRRGEKIGCSKCGNKHIYHRFDLEDGEDDKGAVLKLYLSREDELRKLVGK